jgi:hypothetical protein
VSSRQAPTAESVRKIVDQDKWPSHSERETVVVLPRSFALALAESWLNRGTPANEGEK